MRPRAKKCHPAAVPHLWGCSPGPVLPHAQDVHFRGGRGRGANDIAARAFLCLKPSQEPERVDQHTQEKLRPMSCTA
eukprot:5754328-Pyramimonas_sp.AAC.1